MEILENTLYYFIPFIVVLTILVFVHEFGHFIIARKMGVKVEIFSIGFGKELFGFNDKHGTRWKFCIIPMGGYVKMFGDKGVASNSDEELLASFTEKEKEIAFSCKSLWQKAAIVAAGPIANYFLAIVIFTFFIFYFGQPTAKPIVSELVPDSAAYISGIEKGDLITKIDDKEIKTFNDIRMLMSISVGKKVTVTLKRGESYLSKELTPSLHLEKDDLGNEVRSYRLGIIAGGFVNEKKGIIESLGTAIKECYEISILTLKGIGQIILGDRSSKELGGPIKIAQYSAKSAENGILSLIWFIALMSVNLGLLNLLPIPVLDGGHLLTYAIEVIFGKKISRKFANFGFQIGIILILLLTVIVTYNDIASLKIFKD